MEITETAAVASKSMVSILASVRKKYGINEGDKIAFVESEGALTLVRIPPLAEIFGSGRKDKEKILRAIRELEAEHRGKASG